MTNDLISRAALLAWAKEFYQHEKVFISAIINAPAVNAVPMVQLDKVQDELAAALDDLKLIADCKVCKNALRNGGKCWGGCRGLVGSKYSFEWRGETARELPAVAAAPAEQLARLQKAFALACRILGDSRWARWQEHLLDRVDSEQVCRVCGCTRCDACLGGCYWVEDDLCSQCAAKLDKEDDHAN